MIGPGRVKYLEPLDFIVLPYQMPSIKAPHAFGASQTDLRGVLS